MKIWFESYPQLDYLQNPKKFGIGWYKHAREHKWLGLTIQLYFLYYVIDINIVDNFKEYDYTVNQLEGRHPEGSKL